MIIIIKIIIISNYPYEGSHHFLFLRLQSWKALHGICTINPEVIRRPFSGRACENNFRLPMYQFSGHQGDWESEGKGSCRARIIPNMVARSLQILPDRKHRFSGSGDVQPVSPPHFEAKNPKDIGFFVCTKMFQKRQGQKLLFSIILGFFGLFDVISRLFLVPNSVPGDQSLVIVRIRVAP